MKLRRIIFWLHLIAGVSAGIVVFIMSVTGVALTYQKQMTEWADRSYWPEPAAPGTPHLPLEALIAKVREAHPEANPTAITFYADPVAPAMIAAGANALLVNRSTGAVSEGSAAIRQFFRFTTDWHRYLGQAGESRAWGRSITGASNLVFLFIVMSGIYIWWPRSWTPSVLRSVTWFKRGLTGKARDFNWHNVFGFWTAVPLFLVVLSATIISYPWASSMVYRLAGSPLPTPAGGNAPAREGGRPAGLDLAGLDALLATAELRVDDWRTINLRLPTTADKAVTFTIDQGYGGQPQLRSTLTMDKATGDVARVQTFADQTLGQRARTWLRFVHTGEFYGLTGQTIAGIASAAGVMLVFTGLSLAFRRFYAWVRRLSNRVQTVQARPAIDGPDVR